MVSILWFTPVQRECGDCCSQKLVFLERNLGDTQVIQKYIIEYDLVHLVMQRIYMKYQFY